MSYAERAAEIAKHSSLRQDHADKTARELAISGLPVGDFGKFAVAAYVITDPVAVERRELSFYKYRIGSLLLDESVGRVGVVIPRDPASGVLDTVIHRIDVRPSRAYRMLDEVSGLTYVSAITVSARHGDIREEDVRVEYSRRASGSEHVSTMDGAYLASFNEFLHNEEDTDIDRIGSALVQQNLERTAGLQSKLKNVTELLNVAGALIAERQTRI